MCKKSLMLVLGLAFLSFLSGCEFVNEAESICDEEYWCARDRHMNFDKDQCLYDVERAYDAYPKCDSELDRYYDCETDVICGDSIIYKQFSDCDMFMDRLNACLDRYYSRLVY